MSEEYVVKTSMAQHPLWPAGKSPVMSLLTVELTERCNNACQHCYINLPEHDRDAQARELTTGEWKNILAQAAELGTLSVRMTGGEPLLREDFTELYLYTRRLGMKVILYTNARLITPDLADLFKRTPPGEKIEISAYGIRPASYDAVACAPGAYQQFRQGVDLLVERGVPFLFKTALLPENEQDLEQINQWAAECSSMDHRPALAIFYDLRARRDSAARNRLIEKLRITPEAGLRILQSEPEDYLRSRREFCSRFMGAPGEKLFICGAGRNLTVDAYGICQPCLLLRSPEQCYDLHQGTLRDALENFFPKLSLLKARNPDYLQRCAVCFLKGLCELCPAKSWMEHGTLDTPVDYLCQIAHAEARYLGLLGEDEKAWEVIDGQDRINRLTNEEKPK